MEDLVSLEQFNERKNEVASRIVTNWVLAGEVSPADLRIKDSLMELDMPELYQLLIESHWMKEKQGLPLAYRMKGITTK